MLSHATSTKLPALLLWAALLIFLAHGVVVAAPQTRLLSWYTSDDAFFYYKTAQNIVEGHGVTFDGLNPANGFHPLWLLVCLPVFVLARFDLLLPLRVLVVILAGLQVGSGLLLYRLAARWLAAPLAGALALVWMAAPRIHGVTAQGGLEAGVNAFCVLLLLVVVAELAVRPTLGWGDLALAGGAAVLALFSRLDNIFVVACLGAWLIFRCTPLRYAAMLDVLALALSALLSYYLRLGLTPSYFGYARSLFVLIAVGVIVRLPVMYFLGLYHAPGAGLLRLLLGAAGSGLLSAGLLGALTLSGRLTGLPRVVLIIDWGLSILLLGFMHWLTHWLAGGRRVAAPWPGWPALANCTLLGGWLRTGGVYFGLLGVALAGYLAWNYFNFGTPLPVSGQIKEWWGTQPDNIYGDPVHNLSGLLGLNPELRSGPWKLVFAPLAPLGLPSALYLPLEIGLAWLGLLALHRLPGLRQKVDRLSLLPLAAGCLLQIWTYQARGYVGFRDWYWVSELLLVVLLSGALLDSLAARLPRSWPSRAAWGAAAAAGLLAVVWLGGALGRFTPLYPLEKLEDDYRNITFLEANTPPGSLIGLPGGGMAGYFIRDRRVINLDGLINSYEYFQRLQRNQVIDFLAAEGLDYIYTRHLILTDSDPYRQAFAGSAKPLRRFGPYFLYQFKAEMDSDGF